MDGWITIGTKLDTKEFDKQIQRVERDIADYENQLSHADQLKLSSRDVDELEEKLERAKNRLIELNKQKDKANSTGINNLVQGFENMGKGIEGSIKNVGRLVVGLFGIRSAYMAIRQASSYLGTYDKQYATNIEYIKYALTQVVAPILRYIVNLAATLLGYINAIVSAWFGISLFGKASAKSFQNMKAGAGGTAKAMKEVSKEMQKTIAGFDEMNVLQDTSTDTGTGGAGGGGAGGVTMPDFDLSKMQGEIPPWLQWIIDHKDEVIAGLLGIATALTLVKMGVDLLKATGIGLMVAGIVYAVEGLLEYLKDPTWSSFGQIIQGVGVFVMGLGLAFLGLEATVVGVIVLIVGTIAKNWDYIYNLLQNGIDWFDNAIENVHNWFISNLDSIKDKFGYFGIGLVAIAITTFTSILGTVQGVIKMIQQYFDGMFKSVRMIFDGIIKIAKGQFAEGFVMIIKGMINVLITMINHALNGLNIILSPFRAIIVEVGKITGKGWTMSSISIPNIPLLASGGIINMPRKRYSNWRSNSRRTWSRRCYTIDR